MRAFLIGALGAIAILLVFSAGVVTGAAAAVTMYDRLVIGPAPTVESITIDNDLPIYEI
jgi:hypothetical protein